MDLNVSGFIIFEKLLDLFKIYALKHTEAIIYLTILLQERIVTIYQIALSQTSSQIIGYFMPVQCIRPHPVRKQIAVRALCQIKHDVLAEDLDKLYVDDIMIELCDEYLSDLLDNHAPKKNIYVIDRPLNELMT